MNGVNLVTFYSQKPAISSFKKSKSQDNKKNNNFYYLNNNFKNQPSFGRHNIQHLLNGAFVTKKGNVIFRFFTFNDVKKVWVNIKDKGIHELNKTVRNGTWHLELPKKTVTEGDDYHFILQKSDGKIVNCKDPYAMMRDSVLDLFSRIYNHRRFKWKDNAWMKNKIPEKVSRRASEIGLRQVKDLKIIEVNIATLTKEGNFKAAKAYIDKISKEGIFNTIEIMPVENTHSFNWGYDGVDKFAVQKSFLGGPDALKEFIDYAHSKKINVIMDIVPNHMGPDGDTLGKAGPYINTYAHGPFGAEFNLEGDSVNNPQVRDYLVNMSLNWLENYHCDGLRLDMTKFMHSDYTMKQIAMEVRYHHPDAVLIAEDGRGNLHKVTQSLTKAETSLDQPERHHAGIIKKADKNHISLDNLGFDSEWDFVFFHKLYDAVFNTGPISDLINAVKHSANRVKYFMSHDEIGNLDGTRFISKMVNKLLHMNDKVSGNHFGERCQRAAHATQAILESMVKNKFNNFSKDKRMEFLKKHNVIVDITPEEVENALYRALSKHKIGIGMTFSTPGPKMVFQGDEQGMLNYFKFFRRFSPINDEQDIKNLSEKGYPAGLHALFTSKLNSIKYFSAYTKTMEEIRLFTKDIARLSERIPALRSGEVTSNSLVHEGSRIQGIHLKQGESEVFTVSNFSDYSYNRNYNIRFPEGKWRQVLNSNDSKYAGKGEFNNSDNILSNGINQSTITVPANSILIFEKI